MGARVRYEGVLLLGLSLAAPLAWCPAQGSKDLLKVPLTASPQQAKRALIVGVAGYTNATPLEATTNDANAFAEFVKTRWGFPAKSVTLMTDGATNPELRPTAVNLQVQIDNLLKGIDRNSEVVIYFSGHGVRYKNEDWLVPLDGRPRNIDVSCVSADKLLASLQAKPPRRAVVVFDACRNLAVGKSLESSGFGENRDAAPRDELAVLYSCQEGERSWEGKEDDFRNGVFTYYLLQALNGKDAAAPDGKITFDSLRSWVRGRVSQYVYKELGEEQHPVGKSTFGEMALAQAHAPMQAVIPVPNEGKANQLVEQAYRHLSHREYIDAADRAREALRLSPKHARAHAVLGNALLWLDELKEGEREVRQALQLDPQLPLGHVGLGTFHWLRKRYKDAAEEFQTAVRLDDGDVVAHNNLGASYFSQKKYDPAEKEYRRALELDPTFPAAHFNLGNVYLAKKQYARAEAAYREAIRRYPQNAGFYAYLAGAVLEQGRRPEAEQLAREAIRHGLKDHWIFLKLKIDPLKQASRRRPGRELALQPWPR